MDKLEISALADEAKFDIILLDADLLSYEIGSLTERHPFVLDAQLPLNQGLLEKNIHDRIEGIFSSLKTRNHICYLTGPGNFRKQIAKQVLYKGNRSDVVRPANWQAVRDYITENYTTVVAVGQEADDLIAIECKRQIQLGNTPCVASRDKDLDTFCGWHYRWRCGEYQPEKLHYVTEWQAVKFFYKQMLTGDSTDHILGCGHICKTLGKSGSKKGIGYMKKSGVRGVDKILSSCENEKELYEAVREQYVKKFSEQEADELMLENGRLLYMGQLGMDDLYELPVFSEENVGVVSDGSV